MNARLVSVERQMLTLTFALILAPVIAHGLWRPLLEAFAGEPSDLAPRVTAAALILALVGSRMPRLLPRLSYRAHAVILCLIALAASLGLGGGAPMTLPLIGVAVSVIIATPACIRRLPPELDGMLMRSPGWLVAWSLLSVAVVVKSANLSTFMGEPGYTRLSLIPGEPFLVHHSCLSGYIHAIDLHLAGLENLYDPKLFPATWPAENPQTVIPQFAPFQLDRFTYPPPFLLISFVLTHLAEGFPAQRALWYGINGIAVAAAVWALAVWVGGRRGAVALLLAPWVWLTWGYALQQGNAHALVLAASILGMLAFVRCRPALGGGLLAFATLAKIAPGLLGIVLLVQRRWRDVAWSLTMATLFVLLGVAILGTTPFAAYLRFLPLLSSGEALEGFVGDARGIAGNYAIFGIPFKLTFLGLEIDPRWLGQRLVAVYTAVVFLLAALAGRRQGGRGDTAILWLSILSLAALRSPSAPPYCLSTVYWMISLVAGEVKGLRRAAVYSALTIATLGPAVSGPPSLRVALSLGSQAVVFGWLAWAMLRPLPEEPAGEALPAA